MQNLFDHLMWCFTLTFFGGLIYFSYNPLWLIPFVLFYILMAFVFLDWPYYVCLFFFRGKKDGAAMCHPWQEKIIWLYREGIEPSYRIQQHEACHIKQIQDEGPWLFTMKYLYYIIRYGYKNNPYEIEARKAEFS